MHGDCGTVSEFENRFDVLVIILLIGQDLVTRAPCIFNAGPNQNNSQHESKFLSY